MTEGSPTEGPLERRRRDLDALANEQFDVLIVRGGIVARRLRLVHELKDRGAGIAPRVAELLGAELGWDAERRAREVDLFFATARREFGVPGVVATNLPVLDWTIFPLYKCAQRRVDSRTLMLRKRPRLQT